MKKLMMMVAAVASVVGSSAVAGQVKWCKVRNDTGVVLICRPSLAECKRQLHGQESFTSCVAIQQ